MILWSLWIRLETRHGKDEPKSIITFQNVEPKQVLYLIDCNAQYGGERMIYEVKSAPFACKLRRNTNHEGNTMRIICKDRRGLSAKVPCSLVALFYDKSSLKYKEPY